MNGVYKTLSILRHSSRRSMLGCGGRHFGADNPFDNLFSGELAHRTPVFVDWDEDGNTNSQNPRHFDTIEGGSFSTVGFTISREGATDDAHLLRYRRRKRATAIQIPVGCAYSSVFGMIASSCLVVGCRYLFLVAFFLLFAFSGLRLWHFVAFRWRTSVFCSFWHLTWTST